MTDLFARKGEAEPLFLEPEPAAPFPGGVPDFRHRRSLAMPSLCAPAGDSAPWDRPVPQTDNGGARIGDGVGAPRQPTARRAAHAIDRRPAVTHRLRFTFRLDRDRHRRFGALAAERGTSRQKLLTDILDRALADPNATVGKTAGRAGEATAGAADTLPGTDRRGRSSSGGSDHAV